MTGLIVASDLVPPSLWINALWGEDEPVFDTIDQFQTVRDSVMNYHNALIDIIDRQGADWRPMFMDENGTADLEKTAIWARGFWQAISAVRLPGGRWPKTSAHRSWSNRLPPSSIWIRSMASPCRTISSKYDGTARA